MNSNEVALAHNVPHWYAYPLKTAFGEPDASVPGNPYDDISGDVSMYIHLPFCLQKCSFCSLFTTVSTSHDDYEAVLGLIATEMLGARRRIRADVRVRSLSIGGGTPTVLPPAMVQSLIASARQIWNLDKCEQISVEFSPETVSRESAAAWRSMGVDRASMGVQSFDDDELRRMRRGHSSAEAVRAIDELVRAGFSTVNIDLIVGNKEQTFEQAREDVAKLSGTGANASTYHPAVDGSKTRLERKPRFAAEEASQRRRLHEVTLTAFLEHGWNPQGVLNVVRGAAQANATEVADARGLPLLGFGPGARTNLPAMHWSSIAYHLRSGFPAEYRAYSQLVEQGSIPIRSVCTVDATEQARRRVILGLQSLSITAAAARDYIRLFGGVAWSQEISEFVRAGWLKEPVSASDDYLVTVDGIVNVSSIAAKFASRYGIGGTP